MNFPSTYEAFVFSRAYSCRMDKYTLGVSCPGMSVYFLDASVNLEIGFREGPRKAPRVR